MLCSYDFCFALNTVCGETKPSFHVAHIFLLSINWQQPLFAFEIPRKKETYYFVWNNTQLQYFFLKIVDFCAWLSVWMPSQWTRIKIYRFNEINTNSLDKCSNNIQCWRFLLKFCWRCLHFHQYTHCICFDINQSLSL